VRSERAAQLLFRLLVVSGASRDAIGKSGQFGRLRVLGNVLGHGSQGAPRAIMRQACNAWPGRYTSIPTRSEFSAEPGLVSWEAFAT
jgi:hypothetical protein